MQLNDLQSIEAIKDYCDAIEALLVRAGGTFESVMADDLYYDSLTMKLFQVGEVANKLSDAFTEQTADKVAWHQIRGIRNRLAHSYAEIDKNTIWQAATIDIKQLQAFCNDQLDKFGHLLPDIAEDGLPGA